MRDEYGHTLIIIIMILLLITAPAWLSSCVPNEEATTYEDPNAPEIVPEVYSPPTYGFDGARIKQIGAIEWDNVTWTVMRIYDPATCIIIYIVGGDITQPVQTDCGLSS